MKYSLRLPVICCLLLLSCSASKQLIKNDKVLSVMEKTNAYFMEKWPDAGKTIITNKERQSHIWTRLCTMRD